MSTGEPLPPPHLLTAGLSLLHQCHHSWCPMIVPGGIGNPQLQGGRAVGKHQQPAGGQGRGPRNQDPPPPQIAASRNSDSWELDYPGD